MLKNLKCSNVLLGLLRNSAKYSISLYIGYMISWLIGNVIIITPIVARFRNACLYKAKTAFQ